MSTDPLLFLAESRQHELEAAARRSALARQVSCCSPSRLRSVLRAARVRRQAPAPVSCCG